MKSIVSPGEQTRLNRGSFLPGQVAFEQKVESAESNKFPLNKFITKNNVLSRKNLHSAVTRVQNMAV
jgi:hypothetical protein